MVNCWKYFTITNNVYSSNLCVVSADFFCFWLTIWNVLTLTDWLMCQIKWTELTSKRVFRAWVVWWCCCVIWRSTHTQTENETFVQQQQPAVAARNKWFRVYGHAQPQTITERERWIKYYDVSRAYKPRPCIKRNSNRTKRYDVYSDATAPFANEMCATETGVCCSKEFQLSGTTCCWFKIKKNLTQCDCLGSHTTSHAFEASGLEREQQSVMLYNSRRHTVTKLLLMDYMALRITVKHILFYIHSRA